MGQMNKSNCVTNYSIPANTNLTEWRHKGFAIKIKKEANNTYTIKTCER